MRLIRKLWLEKSLKWMCIIRQSWNRSRDSIKITWISRRGSLIESLFIWRSSSSNSMNSDMPSRKSNSALLT